MAVPARSHHPDDRNAVEAKDCTMNSTDLTLACQVPDLIAVQYSGRGIGATYRNASALGRSSSGAWS